MMSEALPQPAAENALMHFARQFFQWITRPHPSLSGELDKRRSRLLSTMTFVVFAIGTLIFAYQYVRNPNLFIYEATWMIAGGVVLIFGTYIASRLGYINGAAASFIGILYAVFSIIAFLPSSAYELSYFSALPILMTAIFFSLRTTLRVGVMVVLTVVTVGSAMQSPALIWATQQLIMSCGIIFVFITHLRFQEHLRASELEAINRRLRASEETLEQRVQERTRDLEVASDVSLQIATVLDPATLLAEVAERTATAFDLYHVSIFLYDEAGESIRLHQGVGENGRSMVESARIFRLNDGGLAPQAARTMVHALSNDVDGMDGYVRNPLLPNTRSELAMPMIYRGKLVGVLDLQARTVNRFEQDDIRIIRQLADQIAIAVRNSQLFEETRVALEAAERANAVKSTFLSSMSHELRTPMNAIINFTKFVAKGAMGPVNEQQQETLGEVIDSARHLLNLINDVLDMSKIEAGSLKLFIEENIDIETILRTVQSSGKSLLGEKQVGLELVINEELPAISGDRQRILQILLNLMSNACKFTETGGIELRAYTENSDLIVAVADSGPGIAPEDTALVFEAFKQTESGLRQGGGTGLGLPISRSLTEAHGGRLWFTQTPGGGATFYVALPLQSALTPIIRV